MKDPYVEENGVLRNKLNITDHERLRKAEADIGFLKLITVDSIRATCFDDDLIKRLHKHIFEDIFDWAGEYRTVPLVKQELVLPGLSVPYSEYRKVPEDLSKKLQQLNNVPWRNLDTKEIAYQFAREISLLWRVHPFRDGNTRTMLCFAYLYAKEHGFPFDIETFINGLNRSYSEDGSVTRYSIRDKFVLACLDDQDYPEVEHLALVFEDAIKNYKTSPKRKVK